MSSSRSTRSLRKRQPAKLADDLDYDLESLLKEHERMGVESRAKRDAKKLKTAAQSEEDARYADAFKGYDIPLDTLPALCIERIYAMVSRFRVVKFSAFGSVSILVLFSQRSPFFATAVGLPPRLVQSGLHQQISHVTRDPQRRHPLGRVQQPPQGELDVKKSERTSIEIYQFF